MESPNGHRGRLAQAIGAGAVARHRGRPIASIAMIMPPWYEVPPAGYGGLERVCASLIDGLIARGHDVTLFGAGTQTGTKARFVSTNPELQYPRLLESMPELVHVTQVNEMLDQERLRHRARPHDGRSGHRRAPPGPVGGDRARLPGRRPAHDYMSQVDKNVSLVAISHSQRRMAPNLRWTATVHHGIEVDRTGQDGAVRRAGAVARPVRPGQGPGPRHRGVPQGRPAARAGRQVQPARASGATWTRSSGRCSAPTWSWCSTRTGPGPTRCSRRPDALLMPIRWEEPFGMVMIEAMAKGTPVVAMRRGSVPEIILHGRTGVICPDESELPDALHAADTLDPADCVSHVRSVVLGRADGAPVRAGVPQAASATANAGPRRSASPDAASSRSWLSRWS